MKRDGISVVIPVYNSSATLAELISRLQAVLEPRGEFEIVLVDDGSSDESAGAIEVLARSDNRVKAIYLMRNYGQHNALLAGIRASQFGVTVTLDDDLQNPPEEIPRLLEKLNESVDVVYGRPARLSQGFWRVVASKMIRFALRGSLGASRAAMVSPFRAFRTDLRRAFADYSAPFVSIDVLLSWGTSSFGVVTVSHESRREGRSNYRLSGLISHAISMMTGYSTWPLRLASVIGFLFTIFGLGVLAYVVGRYLVAGYSVPGFPFLASIVAIFAGAQLFALGIIGEYLARIHFRMMDRPAYVVEDRGRN